MVTSSWGALAVAAAFVLFNRGLGWAGSWRQAIDWGTGTAVLVGPVAAGLACWTYARMRTAGFHHLASASPRGFTAWLAPAVWHWWQASVVLLSSVAVAGSIVVAYDVPATPASLGIAVEAVAVLAAQVSLGAAVGAASARTWAAPLAAVGGCLLGVSSTGGLIPGIFDTGGVTGSLVGEVFNVPVLVVTGIAAAGIAAGAWWVATGFLARRPRPAASVMLALMVVGAWAYLDLRHDDDRYRLATGPVQMTCAGSVPRVCVAADTPRPLDSALRQLTRLAPALSDIGLPLAARYVQALPGVEHPTGAGVLALVDSEDSTGQVSADTAARALATPAYCPEFSSDNPPDDALEARFLMSRWILQRAGGGPWSPSSAAGRWAASKSSEDWVRSTYVDLAACRLDGVAPPSGVDLR